MSNSVQPHRRQPTRLPHPWDSPGKNTGVGCHFLLQCMKVKSKSEVAQLSPTLCDPMDRSLPGSSAHGIFPGKSTGVGCHCLLRSRIYCPSNTMKDSCDLGQFHLIYTLGQYLMWSTPRGQRGAAFLYWGEPRFGAFRWFPHAQRWDLAQVKPELEPSNANFSILSSVPAVLKSLISDSFILLKIIKKPKDILFKWITPMDVYRINSSNWDL